MESRRAIGNATWTVLHSFPYSLAFEVNRFDALCDYISLVRACFNLYPCAKCRCEIETFKDAEIQSLMESLCAVVSEGSVEKMIHCIVVWCFRLHNRVTRHVRNDSGSGCMENEFEKLEREPLECIIRFLDEKYNIVYDLAPSMSVS
jgi:hypothetical protein